VITEYAQAVFECDAVNRLAGGGSIAVDYDVYDGRLYVSDG